MDVDAGPWIAEAKAAGAADDTILLLLKSKGWNDAQARQALAEHYERSLGSQAPSRKSGVASNPLDGFLHVLFIGVLIAWIFALLGLWGEQVDEWLALSRASFNMPGFQGSYNRSSLASAVILTPILLSLGGLLHKRLRLGVTDFSSGVRLWVFSLALLIGVGSIIGFLIALLGSFLTGSPGAEFVLNSLFAVGLIAAIVVYLVLWLRSRRPGHMLTPPVKTGAAIAAILLSATLSGASLFRGGLPEEVARIQRDGQRIADLMEAAQRINLAFYNADSLPSSAEPAESGVEITELPESLAPTILSDRDLRLWKDPTGQPYTYRRTGPQSYELCGDFEASWADYDKRGLEVPPKPWVFEASEHCFPLTPMEKPDSGLYPVSVMN